MVSASLIKSLLSPLGKNPNPDFKVFAEAFLSALDDADLAPHSPQDMARILHKLWEFTEKRRPGETNILISSPLHKTIEWDNRKTSILINTKERAFLIDSIAAELIRNGLRIVTLMHPTLFVKRNKKYAREAILDTRAPDTRDGATAESLLYIEVEGSLTADQCKKLQQSILDVISDVRVATNDWQDMRAALLACIKDMKASAPRNGEDLQKYVDFLKYLHDDNFTLLGFREYKFITDRKGEVASETVKGSSLGLLRDEITPAYITDSKLPLPPELQKMRRDMDIITVSKVSRRSTVHRRVPLDGIHIKVFDKNGDVAGERLFIGLFTSVTYSRSVNDVPLLRDKVRTIIEGSGYTQHTHDYKALSHILEKYPRDELFQIDSDMLREFAHSILRLQERPRVALYTRVDPFRRYISCLVYVPRDLYETILRVRFQKILEDELHGVCNTFYTTLDDSPLARVLFIVRTDQTLPRNFDVLALEKKLIEAGRHWEERLLQAMIEEYGEEKRSFELAKAYGRAFPALYQEKFTPAQAVKDIEQMESLHKDHEIKQVWYRPGGVAKNKVRMKIFSPEKPMPLSAVIPIIENMGLNVMSELPFETKAEGRGKTVWIHDFLMEAPDGEVVPAKEIKAIVEDALHQIWYARAENDMLNRLIISAQLPWRDVVILRAYTKYLKQANFPFTPEYVMKALTDFPAVARILVEWFKSRHDPAIAAKNRKAGGPASDKVFQERLNAALEAVSSLDQDRILRAFGTLVQHTLRTNFFQKDENGQDKSYTSFKLRSTEITFLPLPRPMAEIYVYSPRMEGVHLRGGMIARGGIRWSDRHEDFRTEILGLMKAQTVKNAVIVPVGAKGGFIVKHPPKSGNRDDIYNEGVECYRILVRGMLDITDNLDKDSAILPPKSVVRHDGDDPYLVVAADKGTAKFSDIANALSADYNFWLADAFASGGSAGYDHKEIGITARGAWECVKRHFRELGQDIQSEDFDVIGVGDMGGDVFGNGMLLSEHIRLVGAFNHMHVFCDPNPDIKSSFAERKRLFEAVKGWGDYNTKLLSPGGRIFNRSDKSVALTPQIKARFGIEADTVTPAELIRAMLTAQADLLWFGGIGTYIKASDETNTDVGDKANDSLRVDAQDISAKVVGEGANLGVTQKGRIEMALNGVKLNADFIDNSGGVDCSDHEVNIKIMLAQMMRQNAKVMTLKQRNELLEHMTEEVAQLVMDNNYQQSQAISLTELTAVEDLRSHARFIQELEHYQGLDRKLEGLPNEEMIEQRAKDHQGLTRPELSILISHAKMQLYNALLDSSLPDDPAFDNWLAFYFPQPLRKKYRGGILAHKLRREIIATRMTNAIVNRYGPVFVMELMKKSNAEAYEAAQACFFVRETFAFKKMWTAIEALDNKVHAKVQLQAMRSIAQLTEHATLWFLNSGLLEGQDSLAPLVDQYQAGLQTFQSGLDKTLTDGQKADLNARIKQHSDSGLPEGLARDIAMLDLLRSSCDITHLAQRHNADIETVAYVYNHVGELLNINWLHQQGRTIFAGNKWQESVLESLRGALYAIHAEIASSVLKECAKVKKADKVKSWAGKHERVIDHAQKTIQDMRRSAVTLDLPMLTLAEQRLRALTGHD